MSAAPFLALVLAPTPTALERVLGVLRNQFSTVPSFSLARSEAGDVCLLLSLDGCRISPTRLEAELRTLRDVREVGEVPDHGAVHVGPAAQDDRGEMETGANNAQEMALARTRVGARPRSGDAHVFATVAGADLLRIAGLPGEIDRALDELRSMGALLGVRRTGPILPD